MPGSDSWQGQPADQAASGPAFPSGRASGSNGSNERGRGSAQPSFGTAGSQLPDGGQVQTATMAAVTSAANSARGLASKVGASLSGINKTRPKPPPLRRPAGPGGPGGRGAAADSAAPRGPQPSQTARPAAGAGAPQTRRALLALERIEPLSVMKFSFLISLVGWVIVFIAVAVLYFALSKLGVFAKIEQTVGLITYNKTHPGTNAASWFRASRVLEYTALVCTVNAVLFTALATIGAALYNLVTHLTGGIEVTLKESD